MTQINESKSIKRLIKAPAPQNGIQKNAILSVLVDEDEDVQWTWAHRDGQSFVTGYEIVKRTP